MRGVRLGWAVCVVAACCGSGSPTRAAAVTFRAETADSDHDVGRYASLMLDAAGDPHVAYYDVTNSALKLAVRHDGQWSVETVDDTGNVGRYAALALDGNDDAQIAYYDVSNADLKYARQVPGGWTIQTLDTVGDVGQDAAIALDARGWPHIAYVDASAGSALKCAAWTGAVWDLQVVDARCATCSVGADASIAVDSQGMAHIAYFDRDSADLLYASQGVGAWTIQLAADVQHLGEFASLALDGQDAPRIAYYDYSFYTLSGRLRYAHREGQQWSIETVDDAGDVGVDASLALTTQGEPRIAYHTHDTTNLRYAARGNGEWTLTTADAPGSVGWYASLRLDASDDPRIAYYDGTNLDLKYAEGFPSVGLPQPRFAPVAFTAQWDAQGGAAQLRWSVDAAGPALTGCRVERADTDGAWRVVVGWVSGFSYLDRFARPGSRYRLSVPDEGGAWVVLAEATLSMPGRRGMLRAWPLPYRGGMLEVALLEVATASTTDASPTLRSGLTPSSGMLPLEIAVFDLRGRRLRAIWQGTAGAMPSSVRWDGTDEEGRVVASGVYVLRARTPQWQRSLKVTVTR